LRCVTPSGCIRWKRKHRQYGRPRSFFKIREHMPSELGHMDFVAREASVTVFAGLHVVYRINRQFLHVSDLCVVLEAFHRRAENSQLARFLPSCGDLSRQGTHDLQCSGTYGRGHNSYRRMQKACSPDDATTSCETRIRQTCVLVLQKSTQPTTRCLNSMLTHILTMHVASA
jgi:hypothetical protein